MTEEEKRQIDCMTLETMRIYLDIGNALCWPFSDVESGEYFLKRFEEIGGEIDKNDLD